MATGNLISVVPSALFRHRRIVVPLFFGVLALTLIFTLIWPKQYQSEMKIEVQNSRETQAIGPDVSTQTQGQGSTQDLIDTHINSEVELLSNSDLLAPLVQFRCKALKLPVPALGSNDMADAIKKLSKHLEVNPVRKSVIIDVTYRDISPELAQAILRELQKSYLQKHVQLQRPAGTSQFFSEEARTVTATRQEAEEALAKFQAEHGFVSLQKEKELLADSLDKVKEAIFQDQVDVDSSKYQLAEIMHQLLSTPHRIATQVKTVPNQYVAQQLVGTLSDLKNRRIAVNQRYAPTDRLVVELDAQIASTQQTLDYITSHSAEEATQDNDPAWLALDLQAKNLRVAASGASARLTQHRSQGHQYELRLAELQEITPTNNALEQRVESLLDNQRTLTEKRDSSLVDDLLDTQKFGNVAIALFPTYSQEVVRPIPLLNAALGLVSAFVLCVAVITVLETTRQTMLTPAELEASTGGIPVLASVPEILQIRKVFGLDRQQDVIGVSSYTHAGDQR